MSSTQQKRDSISNYAAQVPNKQDFQENKRLNQLYNEAKRNKLC